MAFAEWDQSFSVGVKLIDDQHKELFGFINAFHEDRANLKHTLEDLLSYIDFHFKTEERYFKDFGYENQEEHMAQHKFYEEKIGEIYKKFLLEKESEAKLSQDVDVFIKDWITHHIKESDKKYQQCFNRRGLV